MLEGIARPNWIKDIVGVLLVVATGSLYAAGVTHLPCDCGAVVDDDDDVETVDTPIDAVSQRVTPRTA